MPSVQQTRALCCRQSEHPSRQAADDLAALETVEDKSRSQQEAFVRLSAPWAGKSDYRAIPPTVTEVHPTQWLVLGDSGTLLCHKKKGTRGIKPECLAAGMANVTAHCLHGGTVDDFIKHMAIPASEKYDMVSARSGGFDASDKPLPLQLGLMIFWKFNDFSNHEDERPPDWERKLAVCLSLVRRWQRQVIVTTIDGEMWWCSNAWSCCTLLTTDTHA